MLRSPDHTFVFSMGFSRRLGASAPARRERR